MKISHKGFCLDTLEKLIMEWTVGSHIFINSIPRFLVDIPLMDIRYKCISNKVPGFIAPEETGSTEPGITYLSHYPDNYCNVFVCPVLQHHVIGRYFSACIPIYNNDRMRHFYLALEKYWVIQRGYFRLATILVLGMGIIYGKILLCHVISYQSTVKNISIRECNNRTVYN